MSVPRLRMFAGPNGSGKSTIKSVVPERLLGTYLNPDEIQQDIQTRGFPDLQKYQVEAVEEDILSFFKDSVLLQRSGLVQDAFHLHFKEQKLFFNNIEVNAYHAAVAADFLRNRLLEKRETFSFETVMSSEDKVQLLKRAQQLGYRTYLYYIATEDPEINVTRVQARVNLGGHDVPKDKIENRYERSLGLLLSAVKYTNRAYLFDNSRDGGDSLWVAEITDGSELVLRCNPMPRWFQKAVWEKIDPAA